jgi:hypothetical protein
VTTVAQLRKAALGFPETTESQHFDAVVFSVRGKAFVSLTKDRIVQLKVPPADADQFLANHPTGAPLHRDGNYRIGVRAPLADINGKTLNALVRAAWTHNAPEHLAAQLEARYNEHRHADLPDGLSKPALRALHTVGIDTLEQAAAWSEADLLQLHGLGPRTIRLLREALREQGLPLH